MTQNGTHRDPVEQFSDPNLVPHSLLDSSLPKYRSIDQLPEIHNTATELLAQLDTYSQDISFQLEAALGDLVKANNRLNYQMELLSSDAAQLMQATTDAAPKIEGDASKPNMLSKLDSMYQAKKNMEQVQAVFRRAQDFNENRITESVLTALDHNDTETALREIEDAAELCSVWKGTSVYASRTKFVAGLRKRVEAMLATDPPSAASTLSPPSRVSSQSPNPDSSYGNLLGQFQRKMF